MNVESDLDYFFSNSPLLNTRARVDNQEVHVVVAIPLLPSILSRPRWLFTIQSFVNVAWQMKVISILLIIKSHIMTNISSSNFDGKLSMRYFMWSFIGK